jgi:AcrR family transcriptional regulator
MTDARSKGRIKPVAKKIAASGTATRRRRRSGPAPREGVTSVRDEIHDAAEIEVAARGYAGTSLRDVAERAKVTQALINYYFRSKNGLYEEVFLRRGRLVSEQRMASLAALRQSGKKLDVRTIVGAFLAPALAMRDVPGGRTFMRLNARLHTEPPEISYPLRNAAYDESTRAYAEALCEALPHLSPKDVYWRMTLVVGAYLYAFSDTHRLEIMAPGICDPNDTEEVFTAVTSFVTGGMQAPVLRSSVVNKS